VLESRGRKKTLKPDLKRKITGIGTRTCKGCDFMQDSQRLTNVTCGVEKRLRRERRGDLRKRV